MTTNLPMLQGIAARAAQHASDGDAIEATHDLSSLHQMMNHDDPVQVRIYSEAYEAVVDARKAFQSGSMLPSDLLDMRGSLSFMLPHMPPRELAFA